MPKTKKKKTVRLKLESLSDDASIVVPPYRLVNVVSTCSLGVENIDLRKMALSQRFCEFNPSTFAAATMRIKEPRTTCLLFASGNMVITGSANTHQARVAARRYCMILQRCGEKITFQNFRIQNIVASANCGFTIKLKDIADAFSSYASYDPDLFPGLIFRVHSPKLVFLCFRSGKIVITGAKNTEEIAVTYKKLFRNIISKYRGEKGSTASSSEYRIQTMRNEMEKDMKY